MLSGRTSSSLDLGLPDADGTPSSGALRREATTPILILSARGDERDKVAALELGADDYVTKPFGLEELRARVAALLRRSAGPAADAAGSARDSGPFELDAARRDVRSRAGRSTSRRASTSCSRCCMSQPGRLVTRGRLLRAVWGRQYAGEDHYLHVYVSRLRRKIAAADPTGEFRDLITSEPGVGYRIREA